jgi:hypothetical protein
MESNPQKMISRRNLNGIALGAYDDCSVHISQDVKSMLQSMDIISNENTAFLRVCLVLQSART